jgi:hypothetical protein
VSVYDDTRDLCGVLVSSIEVEAISERNRLGVAPPPDDQHVVIELVLYDSKCRFWLHGLVFFASL